MSLNTNEVRVRAAKFAEDWADAKYERGEAQSFYNAFFAVFGMRRRQVATFEEPVKKLGGKHGFIDLFWKGTLLVEHKSAGRDLARAKEQERICSARTAVPQLHSSRLIRSHRVIKWRNSGRYCSLAMGWRSTLLIAPLHGVPMLAARRTYTS